MTTTTFTSIGFIGASKTATAFAAYLYMRKINLQLNFYSRTESSALYSANKTNAKYYNSITDLIHVSDIIFISTTDDNIATIIQQISQQANLSQKIFGHFSGALSSDILLEHGIVKAFSLHPMTSIPHKELPHNYLQDTKFILEGNCLEQIIPLLKRLGNPYQIITSQDKLMHHLSCVIASSGLISLLNWAHQIKSTKNLDMALIDLAIATLTNIKNSQSLKQSLTGPFARNDQLLISQYFAKLNTSNSLQLQQLINNLNNLAGA